MLAGNSLHIYLVTNILILPIYFRNSCHHHHFRIYPLTDWHREHRYLNTRTGQCSLAQPFCSCTCWRSNALSYSCTRPAQLWHLAQEVKTSLWVPTGHPLTSNRTLEAEEDLADTVETPYQCLVLCPHNGLTIEAVRVTDMCYQVNSDFTDARVSSWLGQVSAKQHKEMSVTF